MKKGIQLYSVRDQYTDEKSLANVISKLAKFGYEGLEFYQYSSFRPTELHKMLEANGLAGINAHVSYEAWLQDVDKEIDFALQVGLRAITIPYLLPEQRTEQTYQEIIKKIPEFRKKCTAAGLKMCYHNHNFEFEMMHGKYVLDHIMESDPKVLLELDTFWAFYAKINPMEYLEKYRGRILCFHLKDYIDLYSNEFPQFCAIGKGMMDNLPIVRTAEKCGAEWAVVEQDNSQIDSLESAQLSLTGLIELGL